MNMKRDVRSESHHAWPLSPSALCMRPSRTLRRVLPVLLVSLYVYIYTYVYYVLEFLHLSVRGCRLIIFPSFLSFFFFPFVVINKDHGIGASR